MERILSVKGIWHLYSSSYSKSSSSIIANICAKSNGQYSNGWQAAVHFPMIPGSIRSMSKRDGGMEKSLYYIKLFSKLILKQTWRA